MNGNKQNNEQLTENIAPPLILPSVEELIDEELIEETERVTSPPVIPAMVWEDQTKTADQWMGWPFMVLLMLVGFWVRGFRIGAAPFSAEEALNALPVYDLWHNSDQLREIISPAYTILGSLLRPFTGFSDGGMRVIPVLFAVATILLPWVLRHQLGRLGAIVASIGILSSPIIALFSTNAGGDSIAVFAVLLLFVAWSRYEIDPSARWIMWGSVALVLGITSSPTFFTGIAIMGIVWAGKKIIHGTTRSHYMESLLSVGYIPLVGIILFSTLFFFVPDGISAVIDLLGRWAGQFGFNGNAINQIKAIGSYEYAVLIFGAFAILGALFIGQKPIQHSLVHWVIGATLFVLIQPDASSNLPLLLIPVYLLIGNLIQTLTDKITPQYWTIAIVYGIWVLIAIANLSRYARSGSNQGVAYLFTIAVLFFVISALMLSWLGSGYEITTHYRGIFVGLLAGLFFLQAGMNWRLTRENRADPRVPLIAETTANATVREIQEIVHDLSTNQYGLGNNMPIVSLIDTPELQWYLKDMSELQFVETVRPDSSAEVVLTPTESTNLLTKPMARIEMTYQHHLQQEESQSVEETVAQRVKKQLRKILLQENRNKLTQDRLTIWWAGDEENQN